jgi:hypothetical protein
MSHYDSCRDTPCQSTAAECNYVSNQLGTAVELITAIANGLPLSAARAAADTWLEKNGYPSKTSETRKRVARAEKLDAEIARLQEERRKYD